MAIEPLYGIPRDPRPRHEITSRREEAIVAEHAPRANRGWIGDRAKPTTHWILRATELSRLAAACLEPTSSSAGSDDGRSVHCMRRAVSAQGNSRTPVRKRMLRSLNRAASASWSGAGMSGSESGRGVCGLPGAGPPREYCGRGVLRVADRSAPRGDASRAPVCRPSACWATNRQERATRSWRIHGALGSSTNGPAAAAKASWRHGPSARRLAGASLQVWLGARNSLI